MYVVFYIYSLCVYVAYNIKCGLYCFPEVVAAVQAVPRVFYCRTLGLGQQVTGFAWERREFSLFNLTFLYHHRHYLFVSFPLQRILPFIRPQPLPAPMSFLHPISSFSGSLQLPFSSCTIYYTQEINPH